MNNSLFDLSQYEFPATRSYSGDWRDATGTDPAWDEPEVYRELEDSMTKPSDDADSDSKEAPTRAEESATEPLHPQVEVVESLSPLEEAERQRLELLVERAFYQAGSALRELREQRLYRSSHKTFEQYCQDRFGYNRISIPLAKYFLTKEPALKSICLVINKFSSSSFLPEAVPWKTLVKLARFLHLDKSLCFSCCAFAAD